ncbi:MAG: hypothetical protein AAB447_03755 [Patescibacteria group bacterium]
MNSPPMQSSVLAKSTPMKSLENNGLGLATEHQNGATTTASGVISFGKQ